MIMNFERSLETLENSRRHSMALKGEGNYYNGSVEYFRIDAQGNQGEPIYDADGVKIRPSSEVGWLLNYMRSLPSAERQKIVDQRFVNIRIKKDLTGKGTVQEVFATVTFPIDKDVPAIVFNEHTRRNDIDIYNNGLLKLVITNDSVTVLQNNEDRINIGGTTFDLPANVRTDINLLQENSQDVNNYVAKIESFVNSPEAINYRTDLTHAFNVRLPIPQQSYNGTVEKQVFSDAHLNADLV